MLNKSDLKKWKDVFKIYKTWNHKNAEYEKDYKSVFVFDDTYINLTSMIKKDVFKDFRNSARELKKRFDVKGYKQVFKPSINPATFGTFASEFLSYTIDPKKYTECIEDNPWFFFIPPNIKSSIVKNDFGFLTFSAITYAVEFYRIGPMSSIPFDKLKQMRNGTYEDKEFEKDFNAFFEIASKQVKKYLSNKEVVLNPIFGSSESGVDADGDLIINNHLTEIKCSITKTLKIDYIRQLIGYKFLNNNLSKSFKMDNMFIYWNPLYDIFMEIDLSEFLFLEVEFNAARIKIVNLARMRSKKPKAFIYADYELHKIKEHNPNKRIKKKDKIKQLSILNKYLGDPKLKRWLLIGSDVRP